jgi:hypothetical protein
MSLIAACKSVWLKGCIIDCDCANPKRKKIINKCCRPILEKREEQKILIGRDSDVCNN